MDKENITRRQFLKGSAAGAVGFAALSMFGVNAFASGEPGGTSGEASGGGSGGPSGFSFAQPKNENHLIWQIEDWKSAPDPIPESRIKDELTTQVLIIGGGYAGNAACL